MGGEGRNDCWSSCATIEDLETERAAIPPDQQEHGALMLEARRLRRQRRELVLAAAEAGVPTMRRR